MTKCLIMVSTIARNKLKRQGEGGGSRNPKIEETSFMDVPKGEHFKARCSYIYT